MYFLTTSKLTEPTEEMNLDRVHNVGSLDLKSENSFLRIWDVYPLILLTIRNIPPVFLGLTSSNRWTWSSIIFISRTSYWYSDCFSMISDFNLEAISSVNTFLLYFGRIWHDTDNYRLNDRPSYTALNSPWYPYFVIWHTPIIYNDIFTIHPVPKGVRLSCSKIVSLLNNDEPVESIKFNAAVVYAGKIDLIKQLIRVWGVSP